MSEAKKSSAKLRPEDNDLASIFKRLTRNVAVLWTGTVLSALFGVATMALNARSLGPSGLGVIALLQAFASVFSRVFTFDTWQPTIKYGAQAIAAEDYDRLRDVVALGFLLDCVTAALATAAAAAFIFLALPLSGLAVENQHLAIIYSSAILFSVTSTATGVLRLFNRFAIISKIQVGIAGTVFVYALVLYLIEAPLIAYVAGYAAITCSQSVIMLGAVYRLWVLRQMPPLTRARIAGRTLRAEFLGFSAATWGMSTINSLRQNADTFALAIMVGPSATGMYKIATQLSALITKVSDPMQQALFPEISTLGANKDLGALRKLLSKAMLLGAILFAGAVIPAVLLGGWGIEIAAGPEFRPAATPLIWLVVAYGTAASLFFVRPTVVTLIGAGFHFWTYVAAAIVFVPALIFFITNFGIAGAGISQVIFNVVMLGINVIVLRRYFRKQAA